jgi:hypothetical protein
VTSEIIIVKNNSSINISEEDQTSRQQWALILAVQELTKETFQKAVQKKMTEENLSFILATYRTFDQYFEKEIKASGITLTCAKGCSKCCHTFITSTEMEIDEAIGFINQLPRKIRMPIVRRALVQAREWRDYCNDNKFQIEVEPYKSFVNWTKPCPFLGEDGSCEVYPVRIVDCRTLTTLGPCKLPGKVKYFGKISDEGPVRYRFLSEDWASNLIMQTVQKKMGLSSPTQVPVTPILQWLYAKRKDIG